MAEAASYTVLTPSLWVANGTPGIGFTNLQGTLTYGLSTLSYGAINRTYGGYLLSTDVASVKSSDFVLTPVKTGGFGGSTQR